MNLQKKYWKSDADSNTGIENGSLRICKLMAIMTKNRGCIIGRFPILETTGNENGDVVIVTGDNNGSFVRYTFTE